MKSISPLRLFVAICALMIGAHTQSFAATTTLTASNSSNNQDQINTALKKGGTVYLKSGTYTINGTINLVSNTILTGDRGAKIMLVKNANWATHKPMILGSSVSNVRISGFEIDGNRDNNTTSNGVATKCGKYYYDIIQLTGSSNIEIDHMYLHHNWNDIVLSKTTSNLNFHDNVVRQPGHDIVSIYNAGTTYVTNNCMRLYCNSAARAAGGAGPMYVASNYIARDVGAGGYGAIEVQQSSTSVYNCSNTIGDVATKYALLDGGTLHTGGCPSVPAMTTATKNCDVSALGAGAGSSSSSSSAGSSSSSSSSGSSSSGTSSNTSGTSSSSSSSSSSSGSSSSSSTPAASVTTDTSSVHYVTAGTSTSQQNTINA
ncbi:MAG: hypothetical protein PHE27_04860, partial [Alphaproteobacteria bacterium]|nr:hypothetical protein [Alphaproteobacteria bacterium]